MKYSQEFIERVVNATNIVEVISQYTVLKPKGKDYWGLCPFPDHKEKSPSFSVSQERQLYHCFGCKKGGNIFTFLENLQGLTFPEALEYLANKANIEIPQKPFSNRNNAQDPLEYDTEKLKRKQRLEILKAASVYFFETLARSSSGSTIQSYIQGRKISHDIIKEFNLGFSSSDWDGLVQYLKGKNLSFTLAEELGLIRSKEKKPNEFYDLFRDRLMFTITSPTGEPIGFGGRVLDQSLPKYINSPESSIYHKGKTLYGLYQTGRHIRSEDCAIVVEGYMDLISLYQAGIKNVVAPLGTALTTEQCRILTRFTKNVVVLFDGDEAGQNALERSLPILLEAGCYPKGLVLKNNLDPDEYIKTFGAQNLLNDVQKAEDLFTLLLQKWTQGYNGSAISKMQIINKTKPILNVIKESALRGLYQKELAFKLGADERWIFNALKNTESTSNLNSNLNSNLIAHHNTTSNSTLNSNLNTSNNNVSTNSTPISKINPGETQISQEIQKISLQGAPKVEILLLALLLAGQNEIRVQILHNEVLNCFFHKGVKSLIEKFEQIAGQSHTQSVNLIALITQDVSHLDQLTSAIGHLPVSGSDEELKLLNDCIKKLRINFIDHQVKNLVQELKVTSNEEKIEKLEKLSYLQKERMKTITGEIKR